MHNNKVVVISDNNRGSELDMDILTNIPVEYELEQVLSRFHVEPGSQDAADVRELLTHVQSVVNPKAICDICYVGERTSKTAEIGSVVFTSRVLQVNLAQAHRVFPYIATCGREFDEVPGVAGDPLREYWLDELRIMALRAAAARVREHIERKYSPGKMSSMSPGSLEDWPITQQRQLFSILGNVESAIGVKLTDSFLMVPMKSLSGVYFPTETSFESCRLCPRESCPGRQAPYNEHLWEERYAEESDRSGSTGG